MTKEEFITNEVKKIDLSSISDEELYECASIFFSYFIDAENELDKMIVDMLFPAVVGVFKK